MTTRAKSAAAEEIAAIQDLMSDLEKRLSRLTGSAKREAAGASGDVGDFVSDALEGIMRRVRDGSAEAKESIAEDVTRFGVDAIKKMANEVEKRPLIMLGIAAGIGLLAGMMNKR